MLHRIRWPRLLRVRVREDLDCPDGLHRRRGHLRTRRRRDGGHPRRSPISAPPTRAIRSRHVRRAHRTWGRRRAIDGGVSTKGHPTSDHSTRPRRRRSHKLWIDDDCADACPPDALDCVCFISPDGTGSCVPACVEEDDCPGVFTCIEEEGICGPGPAEDGGTPGEPVDEGPPDGSVP